MQDLPPGVTQDRYCSSNINLENCAALYIELERYEEFRFQFMYWRGLNSAPKLKSDKPRMRDLRPGDVVQFDGWRRVVKIVQVYR